MNSDEQGIRDLVATWAEATRAGDTATVLGLMAEDAVFLVAGKPPMRGHAAFEKGLKGVAGFDIDSANDIQEIRVFVPAARLRAGFDPPQQESLRARGSQASPRQANRFQ